MRPDHKGKEKEKFFKNLTFSFGMIIIYRKEVEKLWGYGSGCFSLGF
jgi:hypothetical protein